MSHLNCECLIENGIKLRYFYLNKNRLILKLSDRKFSIKFNSKNKMQEIAIYLTNVRNFFSKLTFIFVIYLKFLLCLKLPILFLDYRLTLYENRKRMFFGYMQMWQKFCQFSGRQLSIKRKSGNKFYFFLLFFLITGFVKSSAAPYNRTTLSLNSLKSFISTDDKPQKTFIIT